MSRLETKGRGLHLFSILSWAIHLNQILLLDNNGPICSRPEDPNVIGICWVDTQISHSYCCPIGKVAAQMQTAQR
jgi:hypothetical protein